MSEGKSDSFLYLAASHPLLELVTEQILDGKSNPGLWGELPVYLFRGFVKRVISTAVDEQNGSFLAARIPIDREEFPLKKSLISQLLFRLKAQGKLKAIAPLAGSDGCVNTLVKLIGEIERAAKTPDELEEIVSARTRDSELASAEPASTVPLQMDFDREVALIYRSYSDALSRFGLTEEDADQLRALKILGGGKNDGMRGGINDGMRDGMRGGMNDTKLTVPWLSRVNLLVLDGFFDFTPVQGEMLRLLVTQVPDVVVNLNHDERNTEIFQAFRETIEQLRSMASFEVKQHVEAGSVAGTLSRLRENLFNPVIDGTSSPPAPLVGEASFGSVRVAGAGITEDSVSESNNNGGNRRSEIKFLECTDRETEIRAIAKEIKRLVFRESYQLADIALVVRERESYAETIARVMREECIPCDLESRVETLQIPAIRAARKVFELLAELSDEAMGSIKVSTLADLIKSEYFRLSPDDLLALLAQFDERYAPLLSAESNGDAASRDNNREEMVRSELNIGKWDPDSLENVIAYVGAELRATDWLARARRLLEKWPQVNITKKLATPDPANVQDDEELESRIEDADKIPPEERGEKKRRPSREIPSASIAWASLVIERLSDLIRSVPRQGQPLELRLAAVRLLGQLQFYPETRKPMRRLPDENELPHAM
ncbi:MAG: hypothetical protein M3R67_15255, partial [Acidobacteriota bacterium]|nr:hypothetical protein [Acidobacteriota bacterium]